MTETTKALRAKLNREKQRLEALKRANGKPWTSPMTQQFMANSAMAVQLKALFPTKGGR